MKIMTSENILEKKILKLEEKRTKLASTMAAEKERLLKYDEELKKLHAEKNNYWMKSFMTGLAREGLPINKITPEQAIEVLKENRIAIVDDGDLVADNNAIDNKKETVDSLSEEKDEPFIPKVPEEFR